MGVYRVLGLSILLISLWSVSGGVEKNSKGPTRVSGALLPSDIARFSKVLGGGWELKDPLVSSYAILAFSALSQPFPKPNDVLCKYLQSSLADADGSKLELIFALTTASTKVLPCKVTLKPAVKTLLESSSKSGSSSQEMFYAFESLKAASISPDSSKVTEGLKTVIKSDDSLSSLGYALWLSSSFAKSGAKSEIGERIEDIIAQADEVDGQLLQFEGGLSVTAPVINGIIRLAEATNKAQPLTADTITKFGNYLVSRKTVTTPRGVFLLASALDALSKNKFFRPVFVGISGSSVLSESNKIISIRASDLVGRPIDLSVQLDSISVEGDGAKVAGIDHISATPSSPTDKTLFTVDLKGKTIGKGFYTAVLVAKSTKNDKTLILNPSSVSVKVVGKLGVVTARVGVSEVEKQSTDWSDLNKGQKLAKSLGPLDLNSKLTVKIGTSEKLHQVFLLIRNKATNDEVGLIAQPDSDGKEFKVEIDLGSAGKGIEFESGTYEMILYLGDFLLEDSLEWNLGEFSTKIVKETEARKINPLYAISYDEKPNIEHMFRQPEPRPSRVVSDTFTFLVLSPILILFGLWIKLGVNIKDFPFTLSALVFHIGLATILGVYTLFWIKLNMFEALKYMTIPCIVTFITGNRLLSYIADRRSR